MMHTILVFFFNDAATTEIYSLSLHDALPICRPEETGVASGMNTIMRASGAAIGAQLAAAIVSAHPGTGDGYTIAFAMRSEEHTSELQSRQYLVCRLLLEKKKLTTSLHRSTRS